MIKQMLPLLKNLAITFLRDKKIAAGFLALSLTSCGYRTAASDDKTTISIPYVEGDNQGQLTAEISVSSRTQTFMILSKTREI
jgi:hypothetical protein